jgi:hypothetical protein
MAGIDVKWFEHTDPVVQAAFAAADEYQRKASGTYKAYQAQQNVALSVSQPGGGVTKVMAGEWIVIDGNLQVSTLNDADFQNLYELKP